jgi:hypothetical protein
MAPPTWSATPDRPRNFHHQRGRHPVQLGDRLVGCAGGRDRRPASTAGTCHSNAVRGPSGTLRRSARPQRSTRFAADRRVARFGCPATSSRAGNRTCRLGRAEKSYEIRTSLPDPTPEAVRSCGGSGDQPAAAYPNASWSGTARGRIDGEAPEADPVQLRDRLVGRARGQPHADPAAGQAQVRRDPPGGRRDRPGTATNREQRDQPSDLRPALTRSTSGFDRQNAPLERRVRTEWHVTAVRTTMTCPSIRPRPLSGAFRLPGRGTGPADPVAR